MFQNIDIVFKMFMFGVTSKKCPIKHLFVKLNRHLKPIFLVQKVVDSKGIHAMNKASL
jgi:hypothetical protein